MTYASDFFDLLVTNKAAIKRFQSYALNAMHMDMESTKKLPNSQSMYCSLGGLGVTQLWKIILLFHCHKTLYYLYFVMTFVLFTSYYFLINPNVSCLNHRA